MATKLGPPPARRGGRPRDGGNDASDLLGIRPSSDGQLGAALNLRQANCHVGRSTVIAQDARPHTAGEPKDGRAEVAASDSAKRQNSKSDDPRQCSTGEITSPS